MSNQSIIDGLEPIAKQIAVAHLEVFPDSVLTRGRSTIEEQAMAMACNIVQIQPDGTVRWSPQWIIRTYVQTPESEACQDAVDDLTIPLQLEAVKEAILAVLLTFSPDQLHSLSWHCAGQAFDVQPTGEDDGRIANLQALVNQHVMSGGKGKFLTTEGGLSRWHVQVA